MVYMTIQDRIKNTRLEWELNQTEFGKLAGVSKAAVSQWENGITKPERDALLNLQKKKRLSPDWVLTGHGDQYINTKHQRDESNITSLSGRLPPALAELLSIAGGLSKEAQRELLGIAKGLAATERQAKANPAKS